ncbi:MAG: crotonase/enoyl-CoA hydratase family protein [Acidobacteria bacterium]|nr:crotonase/enoyl-CoA hydratase family protein [Acidobacteriota bacterium]
MTEYTVIRLERNEHIAEVILNNPERLNAMGANFFTEIRQAFEEIDADDNIRTAILWAEGRMFTAGLDLKNSILGTLNNAQDKASLGFRNEQFYRDIRQIQDCFTAVERCRKPVIAAVHGHCIGGGVDLTTACDIRLCTADATFAIHETKVAIVADLGTLQRLTGIVGKGFAREMAFTGKRIPAARALQFGLVNDVYETKDALLDAARAMAAEIAANSPLVVQGVKQVLQFSEEHSIQDGLEYVAQWNAARIQTADLLEAMTAFLEKRTPTFTGN